jgi:K+-sensing histidine kinase KdpD
MNLDQTYGSLTLQDKEKMEVVGAAPPEHSRPDKKELQSQLESLNLKLEELSSIMEEFSESMSNRKPQDSEEVKSGESLNTTLEQHPMDGSLLTYRLCSLLDAVRRLYGFGDAGVFLGNGSSDGIESLAISLQSATEETLQNFEDRVRHLWTNGDIDTAVMQKKRQTFPIPGRGCFMVVPFKVMGIKDGFWVVHFDKSRPPENKSTADLSVWTELISSCVENSCLMKPAILTRWSENDLLQKERLYSTTRLCRALMHEVNNPLQVIVGRIQLLRMSEKKTSSNSKAGNVLDSIEANAGRICSLVKNFSDHLHRQSAEIAEKGEINLQHIINSDLALIKYLLNSEKIAFEAELDEHTPSVLGNPIELETALLSLIWELEDGLSSGGGAITLRGTTEHQFLRLDVHGIVKEGQKADFDPTQMVSSSRVKMASGVLEKLGGSLIVDKNSRDEVNFSIRLVALHTECDPSEQVRG